MGKILAGNHTSRTDSDYKVKRKALAESNAPSTAMQRSNAVIGFYLRRLSRTYFKEKVPCAIVPGLNLPNIDLSMRSVDFKYGKCC